MEEETVEDLTSLQQRLEERLHEVASSERPFVAEAATHVIEAGGKRFRPLLVFLAAQFGGQVDEARLLDAAAVMELTHVASLYHDDVMDEADVRRAAPSANARWGNAVAILVGDYLFARASRLVAELGLDYVRLQAETFERLVQGQIAETRGPAAGDDPVEHHLRVVADKTGSLIAASVLFGAMVSDASQEVLDALAAYGEELGVAFQLSDDLIDITSDHTGKTPGTDLREGVATLPTLLLAASTDPADEELKQLVTGDLSSDATLSRALQGLRVHPVIEQARAEVRRHADRARAHLGPLPDCPARDQLLNLCDELVERSA